MGENLLAQIFIFGGGLFSIVSSICNFDFFFNSRRARLFVTIFGRNGARVFYILLGAFLIVVGLKVFYFE